MVRSWKDRLRRPAVFESKAMSVPRNPVTFGRQLRAHRLAAGLTQETLAERSGVSARSIQKFESDSVLPRRLSTASLAEALGLSGPDRAAFELAARPGPRRRVSRLPDRPSRAPLQQDVHDNLALALPRPAEVGGESGLLALPRPTPTNIPWPISSLIGRERDIVALGTWIAQDRQRLVTLTGVGGSGKTRLALQVAAGLLPAFADGVWFVDLAPASSPELVPRVVTGALGVREGPGASLLDALLSFLRRKRLLLVLDNCEHLIDACATLAETLLTTCPDLGILATSREPLQIDGERLWHVQPLALPDPQRPASLAALAEAASVRLFVERAQAIDAAFSLTAANAPAVA
jgi:transcriptional regulator with XRE-family HTH domain